MDIQIDRAELQKVLNQSKRESNNEVLSLDFIEFEPEVKNTSVGGGSGKKEGGQKPSSTAATAKTEEVIGKNNKVMVGGEGKGKGSTRVINVLRFNVPWLSSHLIYSNIPTQRLHQEIQDFANYVSPTEEERFARIEAIRRLQQVVQGIWPKAEVHVFGSFDSQLFLPSSDLDLVVVMPSENDINILSSGGKTPLEQLAKALRKTEIPLEDSLKVIDKARIPIIKYSDRLTDFDVDICLNTVTGLSGAKFIAKMIKKYPALRPLTLVIKHFLEMRALNTVYFGGLGSYTIMCMVLSFLQLHPLIQNGLIKAEDNLGVLLMEFFELYGRNHNSDVVGIDVNKDGSYFLKEERDWINDSKPHLLSVEDPQDSTNDLAKGSFAYAACRKAFEHAFGVLKCAFNELEVHYKELERSSSAHPAANHIPSLLGSIITLSDRLLRHRYYIQSTTNL